MALDWARRLRRRAEGFVQTSSHWRKRNARGGCLVHILDCLVDVLTLGTHSEKDEAGAKLGRVPEEGSEPLPGAHVLLTGTPAAQGWASPSPCKLAQVGLLRPFLALASAFHQTSKSCLYYYCYCYYYQSYVFSDDRSTSGLL